MPGRGLQRWHAHAFGWVGTAVVAGASGDAWAAAAAAPSSSSVVVSANSSAKSGCGKHCGAARGGSGLEGDHHVAAAEPAS